jgi:hypothetical protein
MNIGDGIGGLEVIFELPKVNAIAGYRVGREPFFEFEVIEKTGNMGTGHKGNKKEKNLLFKRDHNP